uniref:Glutamyl/glutaminyl-tRNA synthetase class Ib catalytic domain-containing protein n=1 Tax=Glossina austeni TaxID=7395 RepID=A0A1A9UP05_GLOAU
MKVDASLEYLLKLGQKIDINVDIEPFEYECGVNVAITSEGIEKLVQKLIQKLKKTLLEHHFNSSKIMQTVREHLKWADGKSVKAAIDVEIFDLLGPKTEDDLKSSTKSDKKKDKSSDKGDNNKSLKKKNNMENDEGAHTIGELTKTKQHSFVTGGRVQIRFPPQTNGILHIGYAKAINVNFGYAAAYGGLCYLRYDDTNFENEEEKFFTGIRDMVECMGYKPYKITHFSDYFQQLYEWAVILIHKGLAYVYHQNAEEMKRFNPKTNELFDKINMLLDLIVKLKMKKRTERWERRRKRRNRSSREKKNMKLLKLIRQEGTINRKVTLKR